MSGKPIIKSVEKLYNLIIQQNAGYFVLYDMFKTERYGDFPTSNDGETNAARKAPPQDLVAYLTEMLDTLDKGGYCIELRPNSKTTGAGTNTYRFITGNVETKETQTSPYPSFDLAGVNDRINEGRRHEKELAESNLRFIELKHEMELFKLKMEFEAKQKKEGNNPSLAIANFAGLGTTLAIGVISKIAPEALPVIEKALDAINVPDGDENEGEYTETEEY